MRPFHQSNDILLIALTSTLTCIFVKSPTELQLVTLCTLITLLRSLMKWLLVIN